jgi:hypothetical protein
MHPAWPGAIAVGTVSNMPDTESRADKIAVAMTYLQDGLIGHDVDRVLLAPDARRINNGQVTCKDRDALREVIVREPVAAIHNLRWVVDGDDAVVLYDLMVDWTRGQQSATFAEPSTWRLVCIGERFHVVDGAIQEIEVVYGGAMEHDAPLVRPTRTPAPSPTPPSRDELIAVSTTYLDAILSGDGAGIRIAPDAWRMENGHLDDSGAAIRASLTQTGDGPRMVTSLDGLRWYVEGEEAACFYSIVVDPRALGADGDAAPVDMVIVERFRVHDGLIREVEPIISGWIGQPGSAG